MTDDALAAMEDWSLLQTVSEQLNAAETVDATLRALMMPAPADGEACLWTVDGAAQGEPRWTVVGRLAAASLPMWSSEALGEVVATSPLVREALARPGAPVLSPAIADDARQDAAARDSWAALGIAAVIVMALTMRGRIVGLWTMHWSQPVVFGARAPRMYRVLSRNMALLLDNLVMIDRLQTSLAAAQKQQRLLETVLDHVPVGILCIEASTRRPLLTNRTARVLLAGAPDPVAEPLPLAHMLFPGTDQPMTEDDLPGIRAGRTGRLHKGDMDLVALGRPRVMAEVLGAPVLDSEGQVDQVVVVITDVTERKQAVEERARLQKEVIAAQAVALAERSTPLIPITNEVLVMPLIGTIDPARGQGILEVALEGSRERRARVTILDITGVPSIDTQAAAVLIQTAQALRMLGVEAVLSGVRPEVAQALIGLDVSLKGIVTCGSLQAAIEYAMRRPGRRP